jgi:hypothetical protein
MVEKVKKPKKEAKKLEDLKWKYYLVEYKVFTELVSTCSSGSIWSAHILAKAKKEISKINKLAERVQKLGIKHEISQSKEVLELQAILRGYQELIGRMDSLPSTLAELVALAKELDEEFQEEYSGAGRPTIFMKDTTGMPILSSHMVLGNLKEILRDFKESEQHHFINSSKIGCDRMMAVDIKPVERFLLLYKDAKYETRIDIDRNEDGTPKISERPLRYNDKGIEKSCIAMSETIQANLFLKTTFRCRNGSNIAEQENIERILECGKNLGLGAWRGSGNRGAYRYKITPLTDYFEGPDEDGYR